MSSTGRASEGNCKPYLKGVRSSWLMDARKLLLICVPQLGKDTLVKRRL